MKVVSSKPKGQRILKSQNFILELGRNKGKKVKRPFFIQPLDLGWYLNTETLEWSKDYNIDCGRTTSWYGFGQSVYSLKAVKRLIKKWDVPKGTKFRASLPFVGYDFIITK